MSRTDELYKEVYNLLIKLHAGEIRPEEAMGLLMPQLLACETAGELSQLEPIKELVLGWYDIHPEEAIAPVATLEN